MKNIHAAIFVVFHLISLQTANGMTIGVPSLGTMVKESDTIVKGRFSTVEGNVIFHIETSLRGYYRTNLDIAIRTNNDDVYFNLAKYVDYLQGRQCFVLGSDRNGAIYIPYNSNSIWPQGIKLEWSPLGNMDTCESFITAILEYERLESDQDALVKRLLNAIDSETSRPAALAYLNTTPGPFKHYASLERNLLGIVAARISSERIYDAWTTECLFSLWPMMPQSITTPYFVEVSKKGGKQGELARSRVKVVLRGMGLLDKETQNQANLPAVVAIALPKLRTIDVKKNAHLFDSANNDIATSAPLVFSEIFKEPRPGGKNAREEKAYWLEKISNQQK